MYCRPFSIITSISLSKINHLLILIICNKFQDFNQFDNTKFSIQRQNLKIISLDLIFHLFLSIFPTVPQIHCRKDTHDNYHTNFDYLIKLIIYLKKDYLKVYKQQMKSQQNQIQSETNTNKTLIVVGKMGHGKSSFINSLILPKQGQPSDNLKQQLVQSRQAMESVTTECCIRKINKQHGFNDQGQDLYVMDTPGLDSESASCLVSQQIDDTIARHKCDIIGIAYVIDIGCREIGAKKQSKLMQFLKVLKMSKSIKNQMIFFILSKWDSISLKKKDDIYSLQNQLYKLVSQAGITHIQSKTIKWVNTKSCDEDLYDIFLTKKDGKQIQQQKWDRLKKAIQKGIQNPLKLQQHVKNIQIFWTNLQQLVSSQVQNQNIRYQKQAKSIYYDLQIKLRQWQVVEDLKNVVEIFLKIPIINIFMLFFTVGTWFMNSNKSVVEGSKYKNSQIVAKSKLKQHISSKIQAVYMLSILKHIQLDHNTIQFNTISQHTRIKKLLTYYISKYTNQKVPIAFLHEQDLKQNIKISVTFIRDTKEKAIQHERNTIQKFIKFGDYDVKVRVPKKIVVYVEDNQDVFVVKFKTFCRLPDEESYCYLVRDVCQKLF